MPKLDAVKPTNDKPVQPQPKSAQRKVVHPTIRYHEGWLGGRDGPITAAQMEEWLGWENEDHHTARMLKKYPDRPPEDFKYGNNYLLKDVSGKKVRCHNNNSNRPFDESHCKKLAQIILNRQWVGPTTMPGETVNGEPILISRTAQVHSGQHTGAALILAHQMWSGKNRLKYQDKWPNMPVIDKLVIFGVSDNPKVVQSLDNVKPRTLSDVFYVSGLFSNSVTDNRIRETYTRYTSTAVNWLWKRLQVSEGDSLSKYQTHPSSTDWLDRHPRLLQCIQHVYQEDGAADGGKPLSATLVLSPGQCAAAMYLMGCSETSPDDYHPMDPPSEKNLTFSYWDEATKFWSSLADTKSKKMQHTRDALQRLGEEPRRPERMAIIAKAWGVWVQGHAPTTSDLTLSYYPPEPDKPVRLKDPPTFGGIDLGDKQPPVVPDKKQVESAKKEEREKAAREAQQKAKNTPKVTPKTNGNKPIPTKTKKVGI